MKKTLFILCMAWLPWFVILCMGAWDNTLPADNTVWNSAPGFIRNNWDALEVALGVDISMEGSAAPWYQASAPTTRADGSTALAATDNGLLWVDSDDNSLYTYVHGTGFTAMETTTGVVTFTAADATPTVAVGTSFLTNSGALTISDFDNGVAGKVIVVESNGAITYDTTTSQDADNNLDGSSANIVTADGDVTMWETMDGTTWQFMLWADASADATDWATKTYVDTQDGSTGLVESGVTVFNTTMTAANTFQDLDLSGTVGSTYALVHLEVKIGAIAGSTWYAAKTKGYGSATFTQHYQTGGNPSGGAVASGEVGAANYSQITLLTNSAGVIQHGFTNNSTTITIKLIGYIAQ